MPGRGSLSIPGTISLEITQGSLLTPTVSSAYGRKRWEREFSAAPMAHQPRLDIFQGPGFDLATLTSSKALETGSRGFRPIGGATVNRAGAAGARGDGFCYTACHAGREGSVNPPSAVIVGSSGEESLLECLQRIRQAEIEEARRLQFAMIPGEALRTLEVEVVAELRPVSEVGGDFLDYFQIPDGRIGFYVGDVAGKGLPAALFAALTVGTLRGFNKHMETPCSLLTHLNQRLRVHSLAGRYCAVQYGLYEPSSRRLEFANAALPLPVHISNLGPLLVGQGGLPSGLLKDASYDRHTLQLSPGDSVVFYTDGIAEATNKQGEEFGCERIGKIMERNRDLSAAEQIRLLFSAVDEFAAGAPQHDDMTALVLRPLV